MFGFYGGERSPYPFGSSNKPNKRTMKAVREMLEDMEFARKITELLKENEKKDKDKKDGEKKKEENKIDKIKDFFAVMFLLTFFGPFVGLFQLHVLKWVANSWQTVLP